MSKRKGARKNPCGMLFSKHCSLLFAIACGKGKSAFANHLHDQVDHVSIR